MIVTSRSAVTARIGFAIALVAAAAVSLSACSGSPDAKASATPSASAPGSGNASSAPGASGSGSGSGSTSVPTVKPGGTPVTVTCDELVTPQQMYDFNPNFGDDPGYKPAAGSLAATAVADKGIACAWLNQTSGVVIQISVAKPDTANMTALEDAAVTSSTAVPTYGVPQGYFSTARGEAQVFTGPFWIAAVAPTNTFGEPGDPAQLLQYVQQNLSAQ